MLTHLTLLRAAMGQNEPDQEIWARTTQKIKDIAHRLSHLFLAGRE